MHKLFITLVPTDKKGKSQAKKHAKELLLDVVQYRAVTSKLLTNSVTAMTMRDAYHAAKSPKGLNLSQGEFEIMEEKIFDPKLIIFGYVDCKGHESKLKSSLFDQFAIKPLAQVTAYHAERKTPKVRTDTVIRALCNNEAITREALKKVSGTIIIGGIKVVIKEPVSASVLQQILDICIEHEII